MARLDGIIGIVRVLAISGSLRKTSANTALIQAASRLAPAGTEVSIYSRLAEIPLFNPDLDGDGVPPPVVSFRNALEACDAVLISSPEYAHGVSGVLKNALDWVVASGELINKPVALINASARATHAHASLTETLTTMSARVIAGASVTVALDSAAIDADSIRADVRYADLLRSALKTLAEAQS